MTEAEIEKRVRAQIAKENTIRQLFAVAGALAALAYRRRTARKAAQA